ncbi:Kelch [Sparganum proliferum]
MGAALDKSSLTSKALGDGIYVCGPAAQGRRLQIVKYDPPNEKETVIGFAGDRTDASTVLFQGKFYFIGGSVNGNAVRGLEVFNPASKLPRRMPDMMVARAKLAAVASDSEILVLGGSDRVVFHDSCEAYSPVSNRWSPLPEMNAIRTSFAAVWLPDGRVFAIGGLQGNAESSGSYLSSVEMLQRPFTKQSGDEDKSPAQWTFVAPMLGARACHAAAAVGDKIVVVGGLADPTPGQYLVTAELFSPPKDDSSKGQWTSLGNKLTQQMSIAATVAFNGAIYTIGGENDVECLQSPKASKTGGNRATENSTSAATSETKTPSEPTKSSTNSVNFEKLGSYRANSLGKLSSIKEAKFAVAYVNQQTFFTFNGRTYEQIKGTPMGSPISSLVAELVLQELEKVAFDHYEPAFWRRRVLWMRGHIGNKNRPSDVYGTFMDDDLRGMCPRVCSRRASVFEEAVSVPTVDPKTGKTTVLPQSKVLRPEKRADQCLSAPGLPTVLSGRCHSKRHDVGTNALWPQPRDNDYFQNSNVLETTELS